MTVKYFCDVCTGDVEEPEPSRRIWVDVPRPATPADLIAKRIPIQRIGLQITRSISGVWNGGHICNACLQRALYAAAESFTTGGPQWPAPPFKVVAPPSICPECHQGKCGNCTQTIPVGDGPEVVPCHCRASSHESQAVDA